MVLRIALLLVTVAAACSDPAANTVESTVAGPTGEACAHVVDAAIRSGEDGFTIDATVSSGDTGWEKYADLWQVRGPDGSVFGERVLTHPHETEQPFTRSLTGVAIPEGVEEVTIVARDSVAGFCGDAFTLEVPSR